MARQIISFSGGLGSAVSALIAHRYGYDFELVFADTTIEDPDLYRFLEDVGAAVGKKVIYLKDGRDPWQVFVDRRYIGNSRTAHCSGDLKTAQVAAWWRDNVGEDARLVLGMDAWEEDRVARAAARWSPIAVGSLLIEWKVFHDSFKDWLHRARIRIPALYLEGFPHNNCGGFCVKAGLKQFLTLLQRFPERFAHHEERQQWAMAQIGPTARPFLRRTVKGQIEYLTLRDFRLLVEAGDITIDPFDWADGCSCFVGGDT